MSRLREWLRSVIGQPDALNEDDSDRDGFLSYSKEWHALAVGAFLGLVAGITGSAEIALFAFLIVTGKAKVSNGHLRDAAKEVAYSGGGFVVFYVVGVVGSGML